MSYKLWSSLSIQYEIAYTRGRINGFYGDYVFVYGHNLRHNSRTVPRWVRLH